MKRGLKYAIPISLILWAGIFTALHAQTGTITKTTVSTVQATAGAVSCTFTSQQPALPTGVAVACKAGTASLQQTSVVPTGNASGIVGALANGTDTISWQFTQPIAGSVAWTIVASGTSQSGTF